MKLMGAVVVLGACAAIGCSSMGGDDDSSAGTTTRKPNEVSWRSVDIPECGFRIDLPTAPRREVEEWREGELVVPTYMYMTTSQTGPGFIASCTLWPAGNLPDDIDYTLRGAIQKSLVNLEGLGGGVVNTTDRMIAHKEIPGIEFAHTLRNRSEVHARAYRIGNTVIKIESILRPADAGHTPAARRFFDSFALTGPP